MERNGDLVITKPLTFLDQVDERVHTKSVKAPFDWLLKPALDRNQQHS